MSFTRIPFTTREQWLEDRRAYVTATELGQLVKSPASWNRIRAEKETGQQLFHGNAKTEWGNTREPEIGEYLTTFVDSRLEPNQDILVLDGTRVSATPDMLSEDGELIAEIKTAGEQIITADQQNDAYHTRLLTRMPDGFPVNYWIQVQTQLLVTDAEMCVFACEVREEDPEVGFIPGETRFMFIAPDHEMHERLLDTADLFWSGDTPGPLAPDNLQHLVDEYLDAKARMDEAKRAIEAAVGTEKNTYQVEGGRVSVREDMKSEKFQTKAFKEDNPVLAAKYTEWVPVKGSVSITATKPSKEPF